MLARLIASDPEDSQAHNLLAQAMLRMGRPQDALRAADAAIRLNPDSSWSFRLRSAALLRLGGRRGMLGQSRRKQGLAAAKIAVRLAPDEWASSLQLSLAYLANVRPWDACRAAERCVELDPLSAVSWNTFGICALRLGRVHAAEVAFRKALALDPENVDALTNLGFASRALGSRERAPELYAAAARTDPAAPIAPRNAARMSNALLTQALLTFAALLLLLASDTIRWTQANAVWWIAVIGEAGGVYSLVRIWRRMRERFRPALLKFSLSKRGSAVAIAVSAVGAAASWMLTDATAAVVVGACSYGMFVLMIGRSRRSRLRRNHGIVFSWSVLVVASLLTALAAAAFAFGTLPDWVHSSGDHDPGTTVAVFVHMLLISVLVGVVRMQMRILRWKSSGGSPLLQELESIVRREQEPADDAVPEE